MKYNTLKRAFQITSGVLSICLGAYFFIGGLVLLPAYAEYMGGLDGVTAFAFVFEIALGVVLLILGILYCLSPKKINGVYKKRLGVPITNVVFVSILLLLLFIGYTDDTIILILLLFLLLDLGLTLAEMCLPVVKKAAEEVAVTSSEETEPKPNERESENLTIGETEQKLKELKNLLDQKLITEEQYKITVDKILNKI